MSNTSEEVEIDALSELISNLDTARAPATEAAPSKSPTFFMHVNPEVFIGAQIDDASVQELVTFNIKSVFNLRQPDEKGNVDFEPKLAELGVNLTHYPIDFDTEKWSDDLLDKLLAALDSCPKPALIYCEFGLRAAMVGMAYTATRSRFNQGKLRQEQDSKASFADHEALLERFKGRVDGIGMREYVKTYVASKVKNMITRPGLTELQKDLFVCGQLTEDEIEGLTAQGIKAVLNMRPLSESGQFGAGVLAREEELIGKQGIDYVHVPVPRMGPYDDPDLLSVVTAHLDNMARPLLVHCRTGGRAKAVLKNANAIP